MKETTKQAEYLQLANEAYEDSTSYMDNNLRSQWEDNIRMFNNQHAKGSRYNTEMYKRRSNIFRPKTRASGTSFEAALTAAFFSTMELVDITPENPRDPAQMASARINKNLLQYRLSKTIPWLKTLLGAGHEAWKIGNVVSKQYWDKNKDQPVIELIAPENFRLDPSADWIDPVGTSPYLINLIPMYVADVKALVKDKASDVKWLKAKEADILQVRDHSTDSLRTSRENQREDSKSLSKPIADHDIVWIREVIMEKEGEDEIFYTLGESSMLSEPTKLTNVYSHGRCFVMGSLLVEPFKVYKSGMPELGQPIQEELNYVCNDRIDNVHLVLNKRYFAKRGRNVDYRSLLRNIPGSITMMDNPQEDVEVVPTIDITQSSYAEQDRLNLDFDELVGNFSSGSVQSNKSMNETVGGMGMVQNGAGQVTELLIKNFVETWVEPVLRQVVKLEQEYETDDIILAVTGDEEVAKLYQQFGKDEPIDNLLESVLTINVNVGVSSTNPQMKVERFMYAMTSLGQVLGSPVAQLADLKEVINEVFGHLGYKDGARFFSAINQGQDPKVAHLMKQLQQMQQVIQSKKIESEAKYKIDREKLEVEIQKQAMDMELAKREMAKDETQAQETMAKARKLDAETQQLLSPDSNEGVEHEKVRLEYAKLNSQREIQLTKLQNDRDKVLAEWHQQREEMEKKLEIVLANSAQRSNTDSKPSN